MNANGKGGGDPVAPYIEHARRFGIECVYETAEAELGSRLRQRKLELRSQLPPPVELTWLPIAERERVFAEREVAFAECKREFFAAERECTRALATLRIELDAIGTDQRKGLRGRPARRRRSRVETIEAVHRLRAKGLVVAAIASKLGVTDKTVKRYLNSKNGVANPHRYAAKSAPKRKSVSTVVRRVSMHSGLVEVA